MKRKVFWVLGFLLIVFTVVYLMWSAFSNANQPPNINFSVVGTESLDQQYLVLVDVKNLGDKTASDLHLEASLNDADGRTQRSTAQVSYLAPNSNQRVGFYFISNPADGELTFKPLGYQEP
ncbi:MAG: hypothetical protein M1270_02960 [Gammaproteobacteria bacterium]|nr:hypothetical protein [Gammaproteobacteria bacterium]